MIQENTEQSSAELWEEGSSADEVRNKFVIPELVDLIDHLKPPRILDIGSATGYIAREIDRRLSFRPSWTLTDICEERLRLALDRVPEDMVAQTELHDITSGAVAIDHFDFILATFTLLEIDKLEAGIDAISLSLTKRGMVVVTLPDVWRDALEAEQSRDKLMELLENGTDIFKVDKFTGDPYPFHAVRMERIIMSFLERGFVLSLLRQSETHNDVFLLAFERRTNTP